MHLYVIRHGQSYVNLKEHHHNYIDAGLTDLGRQQSARLAAWIQAHLAIDAIFVSTLRRAVETAEYVSHILHIPLILDDRLREVGNCWPDGSPVPGAAMPLDFYDFPPTTRPDDPVCKDGESWVMFVTRVRSFIKDIIGHYHEQSGSLLVVCHSGIMDALIDIIFNVEQRRPTEVAVHHTGMTHWEYTGSPTTEPWLLHGHNVLYHLVTDPSAAWTEHEFFSGAPSLY